MATPLIGTAIITGGNGALGSEVAIAVAKTQPLIHLLLTARDIDENESVHRLAERVRQIGPRSLEIVKLDLADLDQVATFGKFTVRRVRQKTIPPVVLLINSAATLSYTRDDFTQDGFDPVYQVNCLSPFLLTVTLLEAFKANGPLVMNIGCSAISEGRLDYFDGNRRTGKSADRRTSLTAKEGSVRFGSSKLLMSAAMYGLRRSLRSTAKISLNICTLDPGGLVGESRLATDVKPLSVRVSHKTRESLRPLVRIFSRTAINTTKVPAKAIARIAFDPSATPFTDAEPYYILDAVYEASSVIEVLRDARKLDVVLKRVMRHTGLVPDAGSFLPS